MTTPKRTKRMVPLRYVLTPILIVVLAIIILAIVAITAAKPAKKPIEVKAPLVEVISLNAQPTTFTIDSQGTVSPRTETTITSEVSGVITNVSAKFLAGGYFAKGEVILTIDDITYQVALLRAQSQLQSAQAQLIEEQAKAQQAQAEWLLTGEPLSKAPILALRTPQLQQAKASVLAAEADIKEANVKLARTKIIAPYDAMLIKKHVDIGQYVTTGSAIALTYAIDYAEVRLPIKHRDIDFLPSRTPSSDQIISLNEITGSVELFYDLNGKRHTWNAQLQRFEGVVDSKSRVHYLVAQLADPYQVLSSSSNEVLRIGTFVNASIVGKQLNNITVLPISAVYSGNTIYLLDEKNRLVIRKINILRTDDKYAYSKESVAKNYRLITTKLATAVDGMTLRVVGEQSQAGKESGNSDESSESSRKNDVANESGKGEK